MRYALLIHYPQPAVSTITRYPSASIPGPYFERQSNPGVINTAKYRGRAPANSSGIKARTRASTGFPTYQWIPPQAAVRGRPV